MGFGEEVHMEHVKKCMDFFLSQKGLLVLIWGENEWKLVTPHCDLLEGLDTDHIDLCELQKLVLEEDQPLYESFVKKIESELSGTEQGSSLEEERCHTACRMKNPHGGIDYYNVECWIEKTKDHVVKEMLVMVYELDQADIYRIRLGQQITTDRNPAIFNAQGRDLVLKHPDQAYAVIQLDIAKFKLINEMHGEHTGDELLNYFTDTIKIICGKNRLYSRLSADVFMIITPYGTIEDINQLIETLDQNLLGFKGLNYTVVYGVSFITDIKEGLRKYGDCAAMARQGIKGDALRHVAFFEEKMIEGFHTKKFLEDNMKKALSNHEFVMFLQPKYSISKNEMVGAEALVRWMHPERGMISPMDFIPLFEQNGFVIKMDRYIWEEACRTIREWIDQGIEPVPISVNVSRRHLGDSDFVSVLNELVETYGIPKEYLEIEITETIEEEQINDGIFLLKESGFKLLMDDFGSGYSSLNMLKDTKFDVIKMDQGFLRDFIGSERGQQIVAHTIQMSKDIGLDMVAEGVETKEQAAFLQSCGCDTAQGFYYAKPMKLEDFNRLLYEKNNENI